MIFKNIRIVAPGDREESLPVRMGISTFGITESIAAAISTFLVTDIGVGAATAGTLGSVGASALEGGAIGALTNPSNPLKGAEFGAITGGVGAGVAPLVGDLGLGAIGTDAISGAIGGAAGSLATGKNVLSGSLMGGLGGALQGAAAPGTATPSGGTATAGGPGASAAATAAPASVAPVPSGADLTSLTGAADLGAGGSTGATTSIGSGGLNYNPAPGAPTAPTAPVAPAAGGTAAAAPTPASGSGGLTGWIENHPQAALGIGGIALDAIKGNQALPGQKQMTANAAMLNAQGARDASYVRSGTLPPGLQMGLDAATRSAQASIRSQYAAAGMSGSSAEAQDIAAVQERAAVQGGQMAIQLLQQGVSETNMADQLYYQLMGSALQQDQALGSAVASFASSLVPGAPPAKTG